MARRFTHTDTHAIMVNNYYFPIDTFDSRLYKRLLPYRDREHILLRFFYYTIMSRRKCSYFNCNKMQKNTKTRFHTFPSDINLLKKWIIHSGKYPVAYFYFYKITFLFNSNLTKPSNFILQTLGNVELDSISPKKIKNRFLCSEHFNRDQYSNPVDPKSRLNSNAVPKKYSEGTFDIVYMYAFILLYFTCYNINYT